MNKILIIGCGHMGGALLNSWNRKTKNHFTIVDPNNYKKINLQFNNKVTAFNKLEKIKNFKKFDIVLFAIKPQILEKILKKLEGIQFKNNILFLSIVAGKKISFYEKFLVKNNQFIRLMPNMPAFVNEGVTCLVANRYTKRINKKKAISLFESVGKVIEFKTEKDLYKATAISGSGPAYYFLFIHLLEESALKLGFSKKLSKEIVQQTALGSIKLLLNSNKTSEKLLKSIAVKGGTTEAAIKQFNQNNITKKIINSAIKSAYIRSLELGKK